MDIDLQYLSITTKVVVYDRLSTGKQTGSFETHIPFLEKYAKDRFEHFDILKEVGSAFNHHDQLMLHTILNKKNFDLIVYDETRLSRNLEAAGKIINLIKRNNITVHVAGVEDPYIVDTDKNVQRLFKGMYEGYQESDMKSRRSKMYHRNKPPKPVEPYQPTQELVDVLDMMVNGCHDIQKFYDAFNKITPLGTTDNKIGGPNFIMLDRLWNECTSIKKGDFEIKKILSMFNEWDIFQKGKKHWTMDSLARVLVHLLENKIILDPDQNEDEAQEEDEAVEEQDEAKAEDVEVDQEKDEAQEDMDESPILFSHQFDNLGGQIVCRKCGRTSSESRMGNSVISCEFKI